MIIYYVLKIYFITHITRKIKEKNKHESCLGIAIKPTGVKSHFQPLVLSLHMQRMKEMAIFIFHSGKIVNRQQWDIKYDQRPKDLQVFILVEANKVNNMLSKTPLYETLKN